MKEMNEELLAEAWKEAWSIECRPADSTELEKIGNIHSGGRLYELYRDSAGKYWYRTRVYSRYGPITEKEAVFGMKRRKSRYV